MKETSVEFWFKPKQHGYGATPSNWKGWLAIVAFAVLMPLASVFWILSLSGEFKVPGLIMGVFAMAYAVWRFMEFVKRRTDGEWMWRWNGKPYREMYEEREAQRRQK